MTTKEKYPKLSLRGDNYEIAKNGREPGDPLREIGELLIDRNCFKKSKTEKEDLKRAKLKCKREEMRKQ